MVSKDTPPSRFSEEQTLSLLTKGKERLMRTSSVRTILATLKLTKHSIVSYMTKQSMPSVSDITKETIEDFKTSDKVVIIGYFAADDKKSNETFASVADGLRDDYLFGATSDAVVAEAEGVKQPAIVLYKTFDEGKNTFNEKFDILQGLDQPPVATDPDEKKQRLDWILAAELVAGNNNPARVSVPSGDWVVTHRGTAPPPPGRGYVIIGFDPADPILRALTRLAQSTDPIPVHQEKLLLP